MSPATQRSFCYGFTIMTVLVQTGVGQLRQVTRDGEITWLLKCPGCGIWASLDDDQFHGRVSVDHASDGCTGNYHETHDFAQAIENHSVWSTE